MAAKWWHKYAGQLRSAPASHLTSFLVLHELTAVVPLPIVYYALSATGAQLPLPALLPDGVLDEGARRMRRVMLRFGWMTADEFDAGRREIGIGIGIGIKAGGGGGGGGETVSPQTAVTSSQEEQKQQEQQSTAPAHPARDHSTAVNVVADDDHEHLALKQKLGAGARVVLDLATAYAVVKVLLPVRVAASLALTPWFARRFVVPVRDATRRVFGLFGGGAAAAAAAKKRP
ncbi:hypothetical protein DFJ73DRAFT_415489 [Zopfochytrium polystomum]|nr:hypothetical protein DFJ73DRAFT_415489 [Zopfochytrium polystomum]